MSWYFHDIPNDLPIELSAPDPSGSHRDHTWMSLRHGGDRWWVLEQDSEFLNWEIACYRPEPGSGQPIAAVNLQIPTLPTTWNPLGLTNDRHAFVVSSRDSSGVASDQLTFYGVDGKILREVPVSDALDRDISRLVYLDHDYYVLVDGGGEVRWRVHVYDARAELIRLFGLVTVGSDEFATGITTDGKLLYVLVSTGVSPRIEKYDVRGGYVRSIGTPGAGLSYNPGIAFNGKHLLVRLT